MPRRWLSIVCMVSLLLITPLAASAINAPPFTGSGDQEPKYRADWYDCYRDAEKTVPPITVQGGGQQGAVAVAVAVASRNKSVFDLAVACMQSRGYEVELPPPTTGVKPNKPKGK